MTFAGFDIGGRGLLVLVAASDCAGLLCFNSEVFDGSDCSVTGGFARVELIVFVVFRANQRLPRIVVNVINNAEMATPFELGFGTSPVLPPSATFAGT